jgi:DNA-directed RNA polymerase specialized sigma24 family protein
VDRETALEQLPAAYATALRLNDEGKSHAAIAKALDVPAESVPRLLEIGASKLDAVQRAARADRKPSPMRWSSTQSTVRNAPGT